MTVHPVKTSRNSTSVAVRTIAQMLMQKLKEFATPSVSGEREYPFLFRLVFNMLLAAAIAAGFLCPVHAASTSTEESADVNAAFFCHVSLATTLTTGPADVKASPTPSDRLLFLILKRITESTSLDPHNIYRTWPHLKITQMLTATAYVIIA